MATKRNDNAGSNARNENVPPGSSAREARPSARNTRSSANATAGNSTQEAEPLTGPATRTVDRDATLRLAPLKAALTQTREKLAKKEQECNQARRR